MPAVPPAVPPELPKPTAEGSFAKTPFAQVLVYCFERQLTGTLEIVPPEGGPFEGGGAPDAVTVLMIDGHPAKARTLAPVAFLGHVLRALGFVADAELEASRAIALREGRLHGQVLLARGAITQAQLEEALRDQLLRKLEHLFAFPPETRFSYYDGFDALHTYGADDFVAIDPLPVVWAAIRKEPPWEHVHATLTRIGNGALRLAAHAEIERFAFRPEEQRAVDLLRERALRVHELTAAKAVGAATTQLLAYALLITRQVDIVASADAAAISSQRVARVQLAQVAKGPAVAAERASSPGPAPSSVDPRASVPPPASAATASSPSSPPPARSSRPPLAPMLEARRREILQRSQAVAKENYFEMLGLERDAAPDEVQRAYLKLAKIWHPDRVPGLLADVRDRCGAIFAHMTEAYQTLTDPKLREQYMRLLRDGGATPDDQVQIASVLQAATNFQKAEICLRRQDLAQAEALCRSAHEADPKQPEYLALLTWLESMKPEAQAPRATLEHIARLDQAIAWNDRCERAYFYRGMLQKRVGNMAMAVRDFRRAAELNPRNIDAVREVRLYEMRKARASIPPGRYEAERTPRASSAASRPSSRPKKHDSEPSLSRLFGKLFKK